MSLTLLFDEKAPLVGVIQWFQDTKFFLDWASGPLIEVSWDEFRQRGYGLVLSHFEEYRRLRITEKDVKPVFEGFDEKKYLKRQRPVHVTKRPASGELRVIPRRFQKYSLAGMTDYGPDSWKILPATFTEAQFWGAMDAAIVEAS